MSKKSVIGLDGNPSRASADSGRVVGAKVVPLRSTNDRRGKYKELRELIDAGRDLDVSFQPMS